MDTMSTDQFKKIADLAEISQQNQSKIEQKKRNKVDEKTIKAKGMKNPTYEMNNNPGMIGELIGEGEAMDDLIKEEEEDNNKEEEGGRCSEEEIDFM
jgi:hypothetical protein